MMQTEALSVLKTGANVFLTGEPGAGKTHVVNAYVDWLQAAGVPVAITASTGIAATHIGGATIHSWSGIGVRDTLSAFELDQIASKEKVAKRIQKARVLIIDEISMLDGVVLESIDRICRVVRGKAESFGGLQIVLVGDFFQLPPVTKQGDMMRYAFESHAWQEARVLTCYITEQYRQEDEMFLGLLKSIRTNDIEDDHYTLLDEQKDIGYENIEPTRLFTHNADVDTMNAGKLAELSSPLRTFHMSSIGSKQLVEGLVRTCLSPEALELKEEAMVMFTKNNFEAGYVNGTLGRVIGFVQEGGYPIVKTSAGKDIIVKPTSWEVVEDNKVRAGIEQIPLRLAWAITVHKSQGMSLDAAEIDLSKAFVYGQGYVALSRVRTLLGLKLTGMHPNALRVDPKIIAQDERFHSESEQVDETFAAMDDDELARLQEQFVTACGGKVPSEQDIKASSVTERLKKESTLEETKRMLSEGKTVRETAKERGMAVTTIWGHLEKLCEQKELTPALLTHQLSTVRNWETIYTELEQHLRELGTEKLKPVYEAAGEQFDYDTVRLARIVYTLRNS